jgi:hypothetical protein
MGMDCRPRHGTCNPGPDRRLCWTRHANPEPTRLAMGNFLRARSLVPVSALRRQEYRHGNDPDRITILPAHPERTTTFPDRSLPRRPNLRQLHRRRYQMRSVLGSQNRRLVDHLRPRKRPLQLVQQVLASLRPHERLPDSRLRSAGKLRSLDLQSLYQSYRGDDQPCGRHPDICTRQRQRLPFFHPRMVGRRHEHYWPTEVQGLPAVDT